MEHPPCIRNSRLAAGEHALDVARAVCGVLPPQMYAAVVIGFLVEGCSTRQTAAAAVLPGGNLTAVTSAVQRCLQFYTITGSLSEVNQQNLRSLLVPSAALHIAFDWAEV